MAVIQHILSAKAQSRKLLALLIDPEKQTSLQAVMPYLSLPDLIFVGGSTGSETETCVAMLRQSTNCPIVLFPGNIAQFTPKADALLFLTLLNANTPDVLIYPHIKVAQQVLLSGIETIPMGYILVDGERKSSVEMATNCTPLPQSAIDSIVSTAAAGQLMGKQLIYLEAGSGAKTPVSSDVVRAVASHLHIPLIVGGGICTPQAMLQAYEAGAEIVVIGNYFEKNPDEIGSFVRVKQEKYGE
jgi:putative glycerol-1-phosphate prenyltransferase